MLYVPTPHSLPLKCLLSFPYISGLGLGNKGLIRTDQMVSKLPSILNHILSQLFMYHVPYEILLNSVIKVPFDCTEWLDTMN